MNRFWTVEFPFFRAWRAQCRLNGVKMAAFRKRRKKYFRIEKSNYPYIYPQCTVQKDPFSTEMAVAEGKQLAGVASRIMLA